MQTRRFTSCMAGKKEDACRLARDMNVKITVSSDAHDTGGLSHLRRGIDQARCGWYEIFYAGKRVIALQFRENLKMKHFVLHVFRSQHK